MSISNSILKLVGIEDKNIKINDISHQTINGVQCHIIEAKLSYDIERCENCGFPDVIKNGTRQTRIRLSSFNGDRYILKLAKQRYRCYHCNSTFGAKTDIVEFNHSLSKRFDEDILAQACSSLTATQIAKMYGCSASSVIRIINRHCHPKYREPVLPKHLCFDEFRSTGRLMSFICCDSDTHKIIAKLSNRLTKTITDYFVNRYTLSERQQVETVVADLNAQYIYFIKHIFPNAQIIIDRFHIVQLTARALDKCRTTLIGHISKHSREYKLLKSHWKLFHKYEKEITDDKPVFLNGINEYMTQRNALDLIFDFSPKFKQIYQVYQGILEATREKDESVLHDVIYNYHPTRSAMDTAVSTLKRNIHYVKNACYFSYSNGPIEGINRKIKELKRHCYGFRNLNNFFNRIDCIFLLNQKEAPTA